MKPNVNIKTESFGKSFWGYITGFVLSLILTGVSFYLVERHIDNRHASPTDSLMLTALAVLAVTQFFVQLVFFLHLDRESKPRWKISVLAFAAAVVLVLVLGSIWIMNSLEYNRSKSIQADDGSNLSSPQQIEDYIMKDEGIKK